MSGVQWIFIFLAFYVIVVQKLKKQYGIMYLLASVSGIISSILDGGRSAILYWILSFVAVYLLFIPLMSKREKGTVRKFFIIFGTLFVTFFMMMTIARFGEREAGEVTGTEGGLISYAGQPFINFCFFWDTFDCPLPSLQIILPFTYKLFGYPIDNPIDLQETLSFMSHKELGVFYTFIGHIATTSFNAVAVLYCILLSIVSGLNVHRVRKHVIGISGAYFYLLFSSVLFLGLFGHYYAYANKTFAIVLFALLLALLKPKKIPKEK